MVARPLLPLVNSGQLAARYGGYPVATVSMGKVEVVRNSYIRMYGQVISVCTCISNAISVWLTRRRDVVLVFGLSRKQ